MEEAPTLVDLFCGGGGLSLGFVRAGFSIAASFDNWNPAVETYRSNFGDHISCLDVTEGLDLPDATVIAGGPPCQGFSSAGMRREGDVRNTLVQVFSQLVAKHRPAAFVFENVEGFLTGGRGDFVVQLLEPLVRVGYRIHLRKVNAANYGVPQHRKRVIAVGGLGWNPTFPEVTHSAFGAPGAHLAGQHLPKTPTIAETLAGLPSAVPISDVSPNDHQYMPLKEADLERAKALKQGQRMRDLPEQFWHDSYKRRAYRRVMDGTPSERRGGAPSGIRRLCADEPSKAITGGAMNEFLHPTENRPLTLRECARLQTFPDSFCFTGKTRDAIQVIGNSVPPKLAEVFARNLFNDLQDAETCESEGSLLSFVPTLSTGMSPILKEVTNRIRRIFSSQDASRQLVQKMGAGQPPMLSAR
jgi:DNA (cytosine-5)-methyltransferase 1